MCLLFVQYLFSLTNVVNQVITSKWWIALAYRVIAIVIVMSILTCQIEQENKRHRPQDSQQEWLVT